MVVCEYPDKFMAILNFLSTVGSLIQKHPPLVVTQKLPVSTLPAAAAAVPYTLQLGGKLLC
jgi:hypothetical protein